MWFERRRETTNQKKFPFGKEKSVASYYLARITSASTSVFRSPFVFASEVHVEPFQYVRVCKPTSFKSCCSFALINRKSGIVSIVFQVPSDKASGVVEFYFQSSVLSLSHPSRVDVDRRLPITTTSFPFYIPIWWTRSCGEIKIDPWFLKFFIWKETFWWLYNLCIQGS